MASPASTYVPIIMKSAIFREYNLFGANVYMCYDYVHLDNLSDTSANRNHNVQLCKMQIL